MTDAAASGFCCDGLEYVVMGLPEEAIPTFFGTDDGKLMVTVGIVPTEEGLGYMDHAVAFCPFCGTGLQARNLAEKVGH